MNDSLMGESMYDILSDLDRTIEGDGYKVTLIDCSPRLCPLGRTAEYAIVRAARVSYGSGLKSASQDNGLVNYLLRHQHTSPFEFVSFVFRIECPIFVARQIMRHRTFSFNEYSGRYSEMRDDFYLPKKFQGQDVVNKQGSTDISMSEDKANELSEKYRVCYENSYKTYKELLDSGISREMARMVLPVGIMTEFYATIDLNNLFKFLRLRDDSHAQKETQWVANAMYRLAYPVVPHAFAAWDDYIKNNLYLSSNEITAINQREDNLKEVNPAASKNECNEYKAKLDKLSLQFTK